jgi:hypothetical protein
MLIREHATKVVDGDTPYIVWVCGEERVDGTWEGWLTAAAASLTIQRGNQGSDVLTITGLDNFSDPVTLSCAVTGPAPTPTCSVSPSSVTPSNTATLTINAANLSASLSRFHSSQKLLLAVWLPLGVHFRRREASCQEVVDLSCCDARNFADCVRWWEKNTSKLHGHRGCCSRNTSAFNDHSGHRAIERR